MVLRDPLENPRFNQVLEHFGFNPSGLLGLAAIFRLMCEPWEPPEPIQIGGSDWSAEFTVSGQEYLTIDHSNSNPQSIMVASPFPTLMIGCRTGTSVGNEAVLIGRPRIEALVGLIASRLPGPLIGEMLWEGVLQQTDDEKLRMVASYHHYEAAGLNHAMLENNVSPLNDVSFEQIPDHLQLALRSHSRAMLERDMVDKFIGHYLAILPIVRAWHAKEVGGDPSETQRFRDYARDRMRLEQPAQDKFVALFADVHKVRNNLFKGAKFSTITVEVVAAAFRIANVLVMFEVESLKASSQSEVR